MRIKVVGAVIIIVMLLVAYTLGWTVFGASNERSSSQTTTSCPKVSVTQSAYGADGRPRVDACRQQKVILRNNALFYDYNFQGGWGGK